MAPLFRVLGPLEVEGAGALGGPRPRALLRTLLASPNAVVPPDRLIDAGWGERPPETVRHALQVYLSQLRKAIPDGAERIRTEPEGYRIVVADQELDATLFERGGEYEFAPPPLRLREGAIPLFVARAHAAGGRLEPTDDVARVCDTLDCLPVAIELAAARANASAGGNECSSSAARSPDQQDVGRNPQNFPES